MDESGIARQIVSLTAPGVQIFDAPEAVAETLALHRKLTFSLDELRYEYPQELRAGYTSAQEALVHLTWEGAAARYPEGIPDIVRCALDHELALIGRLRHVACGLIPPGGSAEATLTRTDSGIDLLIEAAERPDLGICEVLAQFAGECDLARIVWRAGADELVVVERRPVRVLLSGVAVPFPPGAFLQPSPSAELILVDEVLSGIGSGSRGVISRSPARSGLVGGAVVRPGAFRGGFR